MLPKGAVPFKSDNGDVEWFRGFEVGSLFFRSRRVKGVADPGRLGRVATPGVVVLRYCTVASVLNQHGGRQRSGGQRGPENCDRGKGQRCDGDTRRVSRAAEPNRPSGFGLGRSTSLTHSVIQFQVPTSLRVPHFRYPGTHFGYPGTPNFGIQVHPTPCHHLEPRCLPSFLPHSFVPPNSRN